MDERKKGIAGSRGATRRRVNLTVRNVSGKPPRMNRKSHSTTRSTHRLRKTSSLPKKTSEREIHGLTIPQIAWLKKYDIEDYDVFIASLSKSEFLDVMELDMYGEFNLAG